MPRSPLTKKFQIAQGMVEHVRENLDAEEYDIFLDMIAPEPEPAPKKSMKTPTKERKIEKCVACNWTKRAAVHKDPNADGYHEFQGVAKVDKKTRSTVRRRGLPSTEMLCAAKDCGLNEGSPIHDSSFGYAGYHPFLRPDVFQSSTTAPPATRSSAANGGECLPQRIPRPKR